VAGQNIKSHTWAKKKKGAGRGEREIKRCSAPYQRGAEREKLIGGPRRGDRSSPSTVFWGRGGNGKTSWYQLRNLKGSMGKVGAEDKERR